MKTLSVYIAVTAVVGFFALSQEVKENPPKDIKTKALMIIQLENKLNVEIDKWDYERKVDSINNYKNSE